VQATAFFYMYYTRCERAKLGIKTHKRQWQALHHIWDIKISIINS